MATSINPKQLQEVLDLITESEDPTSRGREKRKMSVGDISLYDWQKMSDSEKKEVSASLGMPVKEVDNRLNEKGVETRMEFNIDGDPKKTKFLQKSAQAMIDAYGGNMSGSGFDRDIKIFEDSYGSEMAEKLISELRPKINSNVSETEGPGTTMIGTGVEIPSQEELMNKNKEMLEEKLMNDDGVQAFINYLMPSSTTEERELKTAEEIEVEEGPTEEEVKKGSSDPFGGSSSSTPVFVDSESTVVEDMFTPRVPKERIFSEDAKYTDETIGGGDRADPFAGTNMDVFGPTVELTEEAADKKGAGKEKVKKFFKSLLGKNKNKKKNKGNNQEFPEFKGDEMDKYYNAGGKLSGGQYKLDKNKDGEISGADFKMMKKGGRMNYMGGGRIKPFMAYLMGGRINKSK